MLSPSVFKAYDVRGVYPDELDEEGAYAIGRAYVEQFRPATIAVGRDMRLAAPSMCAALIEGAVDGGAHVLDLGMVGTEMVYFAVGELGLDGGVCVTASHNPKQYTGMKIVREGALPVGGESGLLDVRDRALKPFEPPPARGKATPKDIWEGFVQKVLSFVDVSAIRPLRGDRRRQRDGRRDAAARARTPADRRRHVLLRARRKLSEPRAEPAPAGEPRIHRREDAGAGGGPRRRLRRRCGP